MNDLRECLLIVLGAYLQQNGCPCFGCGIFFSSSLSFLFCFHEFASAQTYAQHSTATHASIHPHQHPHPPTHTPPHPPTHTHAPPTTPTPTHTHVRTHARTHTTDTYNRRSLDRSSVYYLRPRNVCCLFINQRGRGCRTARNEKPISES